MRKLNLHIAVFSLAVGCGSRSAPLDGPRGALTGPSAQSSQQGSGEADACSLKDASSLFVAATQVTFDYQPLRGDALANAATVIARGEATGLAVGRTLVANQHTSVLTIRVDKSYKGTSAVDSLLYVELVRSPIVSSRDLEALERRLPGAPLTVFLTDAHELSRYPAEQVPDGELVYALVTPQALMLSSPCAVTQPLAPDAPAFSDVDSERALDDAIAAAVEGNPRAKTCRAEPGSPLDVGSEPAWREYADYAEWTDAAGCLVRIDVLAERPGPDHCDWEETRVLITGIPLGARYTQPADTWEYVRDPDGHYGDPALQAGFDPDATLPSGARDTGFRRGDVELWIDPEDGASVYLKGPRAIERWPRGTVPVCS